MIAPVAHQVRLNHVSAIHVAARTARVVAAQAGLPASLPDKAAVIASELASNLDKYASDGTVYVQPLPLGGGVEIIATDHGPGMTDLRRCLTDGHTTSGSLGVGLGAVRRMADQFDIITTPGVGTLASARLRAPGGNRDHDVELGHLVLCADGEQYCGDAVAVAPTDSGWTLLAVDGLGHGEPAAKAADTAVRTFHHDPARPLGDLMAALHRTLRHTRGAALALLRSRGDHVSFRGVGNISAAVLTGTGVRHLPSTPGVAGMRIDHPIQHEVPVEPGSTIVMHSDGLDDRWLATAPGQVPAPPPLLVAQLVRDHRRHRDDGSVVALRHRSATT